MNKTKTQLQTLIKKADFLDAETMQSWLEVSEGMNQEEINRSVEHFEKQKNREKEIKLQLITKYGLDQQYLKNIETISRKFLNEAVKKSKQINKN